MIIHVLFTNLVDLQKNTKSDINCTYVSISKETKVLVYCVQSMDTQIHVNVQVL